MSKDNGGQTRNWPNEIGAIKRNFDLSESPYAGVPGKGEKSMGDFIAKRRKKTKQIAKDTGKKVAQLKWICDIFCKQALENINE